MAGYGSMDLEIYRVEEMSSICINFQYEIVVILVRSLSMFKLNGFV